MLLKNKIAVAPIVTKTDMFDQMDEKEELK